MRTLRAFWIGRVDVETSEKLFAKLQTERSGGRIPDTLLLFEHPPTFTYNRHRGERDFSAIREELWFQFYRAQHKVDLVAADRGGGMMYHGPGQLIVAPTIRLRAGFGVPEYVHSLEETMLQLLQRLFQISGFRIRYDRSACAWITESGDGIELFNGEFRSGTQGVWVRDENHIRKIGFLGARVRQGVVSRGCAINLYPDLEAFSLIDPCGLPGVNVSSVERLCGICPHLDTGLARTATEIFADAFGYTEILFADSAPHGYR